MVTGQREVSVTSFFLFCGSVAFLASALSTQYWIGSTPSFTKDRTMEAFVHFGLFKGVTSFQSLSSTVRVFNPVTVVCSTEEAVCMYSEGSTSEARIKDLRRNVQLLEEIKKTNFTEGNTTVQIDLLPLAPWASTIVFTSLALVIGLVGAIFGVINSFTVPLEFITGLQGLWVWSGVGGLFSLVAVACWGAVFHSVLRHNVLSVTMVVGGWESSGGRSYLAHSFWFVFVAMMFFVANGVCVLLLLHKPWRNYGKPKRIKPEEGKAAEAYIMY